MDDINQGLESRLAALVLKETGTDGITESAFDDRVDRFGHPALTENTIQASRVDHLSAGLALGSAIAAMPGAWRDQVASLSRATIKPAIAQEGPAALAYLPPPIGGRFAPQTSQMGHVAARRAGGTPGQDQQRPDAHRVSALEKFPADSSRPALIIQTGLGRGVPRPIHADQVLFNPQLGQQLPFIAFRWLILNRLNAQYKVVWSGMAPNSSAWQT